MKRTIVLILCLLLLLSTAIGTAFAATEKEPDGVAPDDAPYFTYDFWDATTLTFVTDVSLAKIELELPDGVSITDVERDGKKIGAISSSGNTWTVGSANEPLSAEFYAIHFDGEVPSDISVKVFPALKFGAVFKQDGKTLDVVNTYVGEVNASAEIVLMDAATDRVIDPDDIVPGAVIVPGTIKVGGSEKTFESVNFVGGDTITFDAELKSGDAILFATSTTIATAARRTYEIRWGANRATSASLTGRPVYLTYEIYENGVKLDGKAVRAMNPILGDLQGVSLAQYVDVDGTVTVLASSVTDDAYLGALLFWVPAFAVESMNPQISLWYYSDVMQETYDAYTPLFGGASSLVYVISIAFPVLIALLVVAYLCKRRFSRHAVILTVGSAIIKETVAFSERPARRLERKLVDGIVTGSCAFVPLVANRKACGEKIVFRATSAFHKSDELDVLIEGAQEIRLIKDISKMDLEYPEKFCVRGTSPIFGDKLTVKMNPGQGITVVGEQSAVTYIYLTK